MPRHVFLLTAAALLLATEVDHAQAALLLRVEGLSIASHPTQPVSGGVDVFFEISPPDAGRGDLAGYQVALDIGPSGSGLAFGTPEQPSAAHPPVFALPPLDLGTTADRLQATRSVNPGAELAIADGAGLVRAPLAIAAGTAGDFALTVDVAETVFADAAAAAISYAPVGGTVQVVAGTLDVDGNGRADALSDGVVIYRYLAGLRGAALVDGAVDLAGGTRTDPAEIVALLDASRSTLLDVDSNGTAEAASDGEIVLRQLFGFTGDALAAGLADPLGERIDPAEIADFLGPLEPDPGGTLWEPLTASWQPPAARPVLAALAFEAPLDVPSLVAVVPEPGGLPLWLGAVAAASLAALRRRRKS